jgi:hypothetical protein
VGEDKRIRTIRLDYLFGDSKDELENFYLNICQGPLKEIVFVDYDGQTYRAKWIDKKFAFFSLFGDYWSGEINLQIIN